MKKMIRTVSAILSILVLLDINCVRSYALHAEDIADAVTIITVTIPKSPIQEFVEEFGKHSEPEKDAETPIALVTSLNVSVEHPGMMATEPILHVVPSEPLTNDTVVSSKEETISESINEKADESTTDIITDDVESELSDSEADDADENEKVEIVSEKAPVAFAYEGRLGKYAGVVLAIAVLALIGGVVVLIKNKNKLT